MIKKYILSFVALFIQNTAFAEFEQDVFFKTNDLFTNKSSILVHQPIRIYATIRNNSEKDLNGVIQFMAETENRIIGSRPFSVIAHKTDDIYIDFIPQKKGEKIIKAEIQPTEINLDNPENNILKISIYADEDLDNDGILDQKDDDIDGDNIKNINDSFPRNKYEFQDSDNDKIGDNKDTDDDNDGLSDLEEAIKKTNPYKADSDNDGIIDSKDLFPLSVEESTDSDKDGIGDNQDLDDDNDGIADTKDFHPQDPAPILKIEKPEKVELFKPFTLSAKESYDTDGEISKVQWFIEDEIFEGETIAPQIETPGVHKIYVKIFDEKNQSTEEIFFIEVKKSWTKTSTVFLGLSLFLIGLSSLFYYRKNKKKVN